MADSEGIAVLHGYFEQSREMLKLLAAEFVDTPEEALEAALSNLDEVARGMPYLDKPQNPVAYAMFICASVLSLYMHLRTQNVNVHDYGARYVKLSSMRPQPSAAEAAADGEDELDDEISETLGAADAPKTHPGEFEIELLEGDGEEFDFGYNIKSCAICHVFSQHDAMELVPYMCAYDDVASDQGNLGLRRTGTIATGASHCDFRYKRGEDTQYLANLYPDAIRLVPEGSAS